MRAYPPTNICPGCSNPLNHCKCGKNRYSAAAIVAECARHSAHLHATPGFNWAG